MFICLKFNNYQCRNPTVVTAKSFVVGAVKVVSVLEEGKASMKKLHRDHNRTDHQDEKPTTVREDDLKSRCVSRLMEDSITVCVVVVVFVS